jgi:hypothetical protein
MGKPRMAKLVPQAQSKPGLTQQKTPVNSQEFFVGKLMARTPKQIFIDQTNKCTASLRHHRKGIILFPGFQQ